MRRMTTGHLNLHELILAAAELEQDLQVVYPGLRLLVGWREDATDVRGRRREDGKIGLFRGDPCWVMRRAPGKDDRVVAAYRFADYAHVRAGVAEDLHEAQLLRVRPEVGERCPLFARVILRRLGE